MNFISETLANLSSGGKLYVVFQIVYIIIGVIALFILFLILKFLVKNANLLIKNLDVLEQILKFFKNNPEVLKQIKEKK